MLKKFTLLIALLSTYAAHAESLGVYGTLYQIDEPDVVTYIKSRLGEMEKDGTLEKVKKDAQAKALHHMDYPDPVEGISPAKKSDEWLLDPSFTEAHDIRDKNNNIVIPAGATVNPLAYGGMRHTYIFIDQRESKEVAFAKAAIDKDPRTKVILTAGRWSVLAQAWKTNVFYDQNGIVTKKLGIVHTPSVMTQEGKFLKIREVAL
jgi:conjugal transfer pilus assembly protein TraW